MLAKTQEESLNRTMTFAINCRESYGTIRNSGLGRSTVNSLFGSLLCLFKLCSLIGLKKCGSSLKIEDIHATHECTIPPSTFIRHLRNLCTVYLSKMGIYYIYTLNCTKYIKNSTYRTSQQMQEWNDSSKWKSLSDETLLRNSS